MNLYSYGLRRPDIAALQTLPQAALVSAIGNAADPGQDVDAARAKLAELASGQRAFLAAEFQGARSPAAMFSPTQYGSPLRREYPGLYGTGGIETQQLRQLQAQRAFGPALANNAWNAVKLRANLPPMGPILGSAEYFARNVNLNTGEDAATGRNYAAEMKARAVAEAGGPAQFHPLFPGGGFPGANTPVENNYFGNTTPFISAREAMMMGNENALPPSAYAFGDPGQEALDAEEARRTAQNKQSLREEYADDL